MVNGSYNDVNFNVANFYTDNGPANPVPPVDQFNFANFETVNYYYGVPHVAPYRGEGRNFNARNFRNPNFRNDAWAFMSQNFNVLNFQTETFANKTYPPGTFRSVNYSPSNFATQIDYIDINLPAVLLSITGDILVNIGAKTVSKNRDDATLTPNDMLLLNATR